MDVSVTAPPGFDVHGRHDDAPRFNVAERFLDRNPGERTALLTDAGPVTYGELRALAGRVGNALRALGGVVTRAFEDHRGVAVETEVVLRGGEADEG
ncbi:hypothetical protein ACWDTT_33620, partial [Streptosporangium sandarakinum]